MWKFIQAVIGLGLMAYAFQTGEQYKLVFFGRATQGVIVGQRETSVTTNHGPSRHTFQPIVEIQVKGKTYQFQHYYGSSNAGGRGSSVPVLYSAENPAVAMIDQGLKNYIPWGPILLMGLLAFMGAIDRRNGVIIAPRGPVTIDEAHRLALLGQKITAIKIYRKATGAGLKEAKEYIDQFIGSKKE